MMKRRIISILLAFTIIFSSTSTYISFADNNINVLMNNEEFKPEGKVLIENDTIYIPIRELGEKLGFEITWSHKDRKVEISDFKNKSWIKINDKKIIHNGEEYELEEPVILKGKLTYVPIELIGNYLDLETTWDVNSDTFTINNMKDNTESIFEISKDKATREKLEKYMEELKKKQNFQGTVLVSKDNKILLDEGYNFSNIEHKLENNSQTKFAIGSVTKQFIAMGLMQLEEKGLLKLEDTIDKYIDGLKYGKDITIHELLTHSSGLVNVTTLEEFYSLEESTEEDIINLIKDKELNFKPGEKFDYSNTNYILLGMIIEKVSELDMEDYLNKNIFKPLSMDNTGLIYKNNKNANIATPYQGYLELVEADDRPLLYNAYGAGNIYSTVEDLYRWSKGIDDNKLVKKETLDKVFKGYSQVSEGVEYGYGWLVSDTDFGKLYVHDGATLGFTSVIAKYPEENLNIVILSNTRGGNNLYEILNNLSSIALGKEVELPEIPEQPEIIEVDPVEYDKYVGEYIVTEDLSIDILKENNKLYIQLTGQPKIEIYPEGNNKFFLRLVDAKVEFFLNEKDEAKELILYQSGMELKAKNVKYISETEDIKVDEKVLDKYIGEYKLAEGLNLTITRKGNKLFAKVTGQEPIQVYPISETKFEYRIIDADIEFKEGKDGKVNDLLFTQMGRELKGERIK